MNSLRNRLIGAAFLVLVLFFGLIGLSMERAFEHSARLALRDRLQGQIYALLAVAEFGRDGQISMPELLPEVRFSTPWSGLYAQITDDAGKTVWRSFQDAGEIRFATGLGPSEFSFQKLDGPDGRMLLGLSFGLVWQNENGQLQSNSFSVAEDLDALERQIANFRQTLWSWLGLVLIALLFTQWAVLRWGLAPLRRVASDLAAIESGQQKNLGGVYPEELRGLTDSLNGLIDHQQQQLDRHRNRLSDLAHSLKTPLAVLGGMINSQSEPDVGAVQKQIDEMAVGIDYQLQRAATAGKIGPIHSVLVKPVARRILAAMEKVYRDSRIECQLIVQDEMTFAGDEGDLLEVLGNIIENAYKWCSGQVRVQIAKSDRSDGTSLRVQIDDDGPGIDPDLIDEVQRRGVRGDESTEGHGVGLAIVRDMVDLYGGDLTITKGELGGAQITIRL